MLIRNYYRTAIRQIGRSRFHSLLNIVGLSIGIGFFLLIAAFAYSEWRVNRDLRHADRQYFLESVWKDPGMGLSVTTLGQLGPALKAKYHSLVAKYYRWDGLGVTVSTRDKIFEENIEVGDSTLMDMYGFKLLSGDPRTAMRDPFTIVITARKAIKYFGRTDVVGRNLTVANFSGGKQDFRITAVMDDPPFNSVTGLIGTVDNRIFVPTANLPFFGRNMDWQNIFIPSYVELQPGVRPEQLVEPIHHLIKINFPQVADLLKVNPRPLTEYYLFTARRMITTMSYIAAFILLMAVINFVNLAVGRSASRMKEIGVRKVLGGLRTQLIGQFLAESFLLSVLATAFALLLYLVGRPFFSGMLGRDLPSLAAFPSETWLLLPVFAILLGGLAGLYPAFVLSAMPGIDSLRGHGSTIRENTILRKGLVGLQFAVAIIALVGVVVISQQVRLFFSDRLGYKKEYVMSAKLPRDWSVQGVQRMETVRDIFAGMPGVKDVAVSYEIPNGNNGSNRSIYREGGDSIHAMTIQQFNADQHYGSVYQIPMAAGVFFSDNRVFDSSDSLRVVINETASRALGWHQPRAAVGQRIRLVNGPQPFSIAGVVKDFHFDAMGAPITPEIFLNLSRAITYRFISFRLQPGNMAATLASLQGQWSRLLPGAPFEYQFMDQTLAAVYDAELRLQKAANTAMLLSLVIVVIGVIGMLSLSVQKRTKEIAIRKVIGASVPAIIRLFLLEYLPLLLAAGLIASPFAYWILQRWLDDYATRITITVIPFAAAVGALALLMGLLIIAQTANAALANPVKNLKTE